MIFSCVIYQQPTQLRFTPKEAPKSQLIYGSNICCTRKLLIKALEE